MKINKRNSFVTSCFVKFVRCYSSNVEVTEELLKKMLMQWPFKTPSNMKELQSLEDVFDVLDLYLWLSFRFSSIFCQTEKISVMREELENVILNGNISFQ